MRNCYYSLLYMLILCSVSRMFHWSLKKEETEANLSCNSVLHKLLEFHDEIICINLLVILCCE